MTFDIRLWIGESCSAENVPKKDRVSERNRGILFRTTLIMPSFGSLHRHHQRSHPDPKDRHGYLNPTVHHRSGREWRNRRADRRPSIIYMSWPRPSASHSPRPSSRDTTTARINRQTWITHESWIRFLRNLSCSRRARQKRSNLARNCSGRRGRLRSERLYFWDTARSWLNLDNVAGIGRIKVGLRNSDRFRFKVKD